MKGSVYYMMTNLTNNGEEWVSNVLGKNFTHLHDMKVIHNDVAFVTLVIPKSLNTINNIYYQYDIVPEEARFFDKTFCYIYDDVDKSVFKILHKQR